MEELSPSAYAVLGLIARHGPMTPYELKARVEESVAPFWPVPHAQLYRDPPKLAGLGLLREEAEETGRRRRVFHLTTAGREVLDRWLCDPATSTAETRDPAQVKLSFIDMADPSALTALAREQARIHRDLLASYTARRAALDPSDPAYDSRRRMLAYGILHEQAHARFWDSLTTNPPTDPL
jgi:DNA-binding PadR family transcriptional regulator